MKTDCQVEACLQLARQGFNQEMEPTLTESGTSGAYIIRCEDGPVAVFKPIDEEPNAPFNPRGMEGQFGSDTCRAGVKSGESTLREVAAYLMDHEGFSGVPATSLVELRHDALPAAPITDDHIASEEYRNMLEDFFPIASGKNSKKFTAIEEVSEHSASTLNSDRSFEEPAKKKLTKVGSFQSFVKSEGPIENYSSDLFSKDEIHKIAVLDMRILNLDRNTDNILVQRTAEGFRLVPIDHGLSIPDSLEVCSYDLAWLGYD